MNNKMVKHKVVLLPDSAPSQPSSKLGPLSGRSKKNEALLPALEFSTSKQYDGLFKLPDGSYKQVIELSGLGVCNSSEALAKFESQFKQLLDTTNCAVQLIASSRPISVGSADLFHDIVGRAENDYLIWYSDYIFKWFYRVAAVTYLPRLSFFVVLTAKATRSKEGINSWREAKAQFTQCSDVLQAAGQEIAVLGRDAVRNLLMHSFIAPHLHSGLDSAGPVAESLSTSTISEPQCVEEDGMVRIGDALHGACGILSLPSELSIGWLANVLVSAVPYTVSVHFHQCDQKAVGQTILAITDRQRHKAPLKNLLNGKSRALDVSLYFSSFSKSATELKSNLADLEKHFVRIGAVFSNFKARPKDALRSCLPLGLDALQTDHRVTSEVAATCWPAFGTLTKQKIGMPLAYSVASREPYFIDPLSRDHYLAVDSTNERARSILTVMALRHLAVNFRVLNLSACEKTNFLPRILGAETSFTPTLSGVKPKAESLRCPLVSIDISKSKRLNRQQLDWLRQTARRWLDGDKQVLLIEDAGPFLASREGTACLKELVALAKKRRARVCLGVNPQQLRKAPDLWQFFDNKMIFQPNRADTPLVEKYLGLKGKFQLWDKVVSYLLVTPSRQAVLGLLWSPMEAGIVLKNSAERRDRTAKYRQKRLSLYKDIKQKNPNMKETDAWRQAIYYFGLQSE